MPTLTGSMKPVVRIRSALGTILVRLLHGREAMAMAGWSRHDYSCEPSASHATMLSLAGNAFSAYSVGPLLLGVMMSMCSESCHQELALPRSMPNANDEEVEEDWLAA